MPTVGNSIDINWTLQVHEHLDFNRENLQTNFLLTDFKIWQLQRCKIKLMFV